MKLAIVLDELAMAVSVEMLEHEENRRYGLCKGRTGCGGVRTPDVCFVTGTASIFAVASRLDVACRSCVPISPHASRIVPRFVRELAAETHPTQCIVWKAVDEVTGQPHRFMPERAEEGDVWQFHRSRPVTQSPFSWCPFSPKAMSTVIKSPITVSRCAPPTFLACGQQQW